MPARTADGLPDGWWARSVEPGDAGSPPAETLVWVLSAEFPANTTVTLPGNRRPAAWRMAVRHAGATGPVASIEVALPDAPVLWYVDVPEPAADPAAATLVAFSDSRHPDGTVLTADQASAEGISGNQQVAAIRWWPATGLVHQLYVAPAHRRNGVAGKLAHAAFGLQAVRRRPPLHGDGRRTDDGEAFTRALPSYGAWRVAPRSEHLPSMTPVG